MAKLFGFMPDIKSLTSELNQKFDVLINEIRLVQQAVREVTAELRTQRGAPQ